MKTIPRFVVLYWTIRSSLANSQFVVSEDELGKLQADLRADNDVTEIAVYSFLNASQRTVSFSPLSPT